MKISVTRILLVFQVFQVCAFASNSVVNLSHYDLMRVDFERMKSEGIAGVIHEATYPRFDRDSYYGSRKDAATRAKPCARTEYYWCSILRRTITIRAARCELIKPSRLLSGFGSGPGSIPVFMAVSIGSAPC